VSAKTFFLLGLWLAVVDSTGGRGQKGSGTGCLRGEAMQIKEGQGNERKGVVVIARSIYEWGGGTGQVFLLRVRGRPHPQIFHIWLVATRTASAKSHATFHTSGAWRCESKTSESDTVDDGKPVVKFYARAANPKLEHAVTSFRRGKKNRSKKSVVNELQVPW
jgi:hypothetical protein